MQGKNGIGVQAGFKHFFLINNSLHISVNKLFDKLYIMVIFNVYICPDLCY